MGNKCFKRKSAEQPDGGEPNNKSNKKNKKQKRYEVTSPGAENKAYSSDERGRDKNFANLGSVPTDADGNIIHVPGNGEQVTIEWANGPNSERPVDVPADQLTPDHSDDERITPKHTNNVTVSEIQNVAVASANVSETTTAVSDTKTARVNVEMHTNNVDETDDSPINFHDGQCESLSDISIHENVTKDDESTVEIQGYDTVKLTKHSDDVQRDDNDVSTSRAPAIVPKRSSVTDSEPRSASDSDDADLNKAYPDIMQVMKTDGGYQNPMFGDQSAAAFDDEAIVSIREPYTKPQDASAQDLNLASADVTRYDKDERDSLDSHSEKADSMKATSSRSSSSSRSASSDSVRDAAEQRVDSVIRAADSATVVASAKQQLDIEADIVDMTAIKPEFEAVVDVHASKDTSSDSESGDVIAGDNEHDATPDTVVLRQSDSDSDNPDVTALGDDDMHDGVEADRELSEIFMVRDQTTSTVHHLRHIINPSLFKQ